MNTHRFFQCLGEPTRLYAMLLLQERGELCVCELVAALDQSQPKVSRHLAQLRYCELLADERRGQWVYYRLHPALPAWTLAILEQAGTAEADTLAVMGQRLDGAPGLPASPGRGAIACG
ncbi:MAG: metalloregulator ArsR/SmtB family transcription factor [Pseudohaliea sp.]